ncbi:uncharacterized protein LOC108488489 isoform X1 [Gossypium arboreum]|uniref:uncharacterized protein LOC108488489 isoform X1 n=1 Tax=Gossypium arboreum TaxID=29729 RepID=UPI000819633F|nr:uncharacterized protein LOC108488489 isoform X1 [Gossypium arboreum]
MAKSSQNPAVNRSEKRKKSLRLSSLFQDFLNLVVTAKKWLKRLTVPTISICLFHNSQRRIFNPQKICFILQTLDSHRMCCSISFTCNKLDSARMKESRQILHISEQTEVHVEMPALRLPTESDIPASTLILTHSCGGGIHLIMDLGLGCFRFKAQPQYSKPKLLMIKGRQFKSELSSKKNVRKLKS